MKGRHRALPRWGRSKSRGSDFRRAVRHDFDGKVRRKSDPRRVGLALRSSVFLAFLLALVGCDSPEATRRHGENGGDGHNYVSRPIAVPSKLDGTKDLSRFRERGPT